MFWSSALRMNISSGEIVGGGGGGAGEAGRDPAREDVDGFID